MTDDLSPNERTVLDELPATTDEIMQLLGCSESYARDVPADIRQKGYPVHHDGSQYVYDSDIPAESDGPSTPGEKSNITRKFREKLSTLEEDVAEMIDGSAPPQSGVPHGVGDADLVLHRTDDHFGEEVEEDGQITYNSEIAESRVHEYFAAAREFVAEQREAGREIDRAHLLLGGDIVTNESIYEGQAHDIDENLYEQMDRAVDTYFEELVALSEEMDAVQVVCQAGNHGELRAPNSSTAANADDIVYMMLDKMVRESQLDNITMLQSDSQYYIDFQIRDWNAHLRHGHDASLEHIGTSAGKQRWLSWLADHQFDVAFRGHYHTVKEEPIAGRPVHMGGSLAPQSEFEESRAISGVPAAVMHLSTDNSPTEVTKRVYYDNPE